MTDSSKNAENAFLEPEFEFRWDPDRIRFVNRDITDYLESRLFIKPDFSCPDDAEEAEIQAALEFDENVEAYASRNATEVDESREGLLCIGDDPAIESNNPIKRLAVAPSTTLVEVKQNNGFFARVCNKQKVSKCDLV